jgi:meso-butanediol dehydrogenase / (S,S)-butanediol dehydrogenase / diacetyl reductase
MSHDLSDLNILITGSGRGLGRAAALHLASLGATIAVVDIKGLSAQHVAEEITAAGGKAFGYQADLSSQEAFREVAEEFAGQVGRIDAVVNNAAVLRYEPIEAVTEETVDLMLGAGLKAAYWGAQALLRHMDPERGGSIVSYSSPVAFRGYPNSAIYSSIKGAVAAMTRTLAAELGPRKVRVNALAPGSVPTPATAGVVDEAEYDRRRKSIPLRRLGQESDNNNALAFLLSKDAEFINGIVLHVDGGIAAAN